MMDLTKAQREILHHCHRAGGRYVADHGDRDCERLDELGLLRRVATTAVFPGANYRLTDAGRGWCLREEDAEPAEAGEEMTP